MSATFATETVRAARSLLFVPGNRPERFPKAAAAQPDIVILDLEDAVAGPHKGSARRHVGDWLAAGHPAMVRINAEGTPWHDDDVVLVGEHRPAVMLAKAERPDQIRRLTESAPGVPVVPLIETAIGIAAVNELCAVDGVTRLAFGSIDLANQLGVDPDDREVLLPHRSWLVLASAAAGLAPPIDGVTTALTQPDSVAADFRYARRLGMSAKLCIHPAQVAAVHAAAAPSDADVQWAGRIVKSLDAADGSAVAIEGQMVDAPVLERARRILAAAERN